MPTSAILPVIKLESSCNDETMSSTRFGRIGTWMHYTDTKETDLSRKQCYPGRPRVTTRPTDGIIKIRDCKVSDLSFGHYLTYMPLVVMVMLIVA
jgi:hypothetical protein